MLTLKDYQQRALDTLQTYFHLAQQLGNANLAFYQTTLQTTGRGIPYQPIDVLPDLPYVCIRIPTGGGKTLVASHAVGLTAHELLHSDHALVLWLAPSNAIRDQTLRALADPQHPYRQAIESRVGPVTVMSVSEALYVQPATLNSSTTIIVGTIQAFRVDNTEGRKVYESSGALMSHFSDLPAELRGGLEMGNGEPKKSLANVLYMRRPVVVVDEAHNARTSLSFDTLARFHPACILEFTATPAVQGTPSNVLHSSSAAELKAEAMIKMPIRLRVRPQWKELLSDAVLQRNRLEAAAKIEHKATGEYIRPVMLLQAQPRSQARETLTMDLVRQTLLEDFRIPENQIARATGELDEIGDTDLSRPDCPIRYVITVQALREGWDCPFAYVLCSVAESRSSTAVEQILGRILRLPQAHRKQADVLNRAYAFATSSSFGEIANQLRDSLVQNGFERFEAQTMIQTWGAQGALPLFDQNSDDTLPEPVSIPLPASVSLEEITLDVTPNVTYDQTSHALVVRRRLEAQEADLLVASILDGVVAGEVRKAIEPLTKPEPVGPTTSPAERGEVFQVPLLVYHTDGQLELFEETAFLDHPWDLSQCDALLSVGEYSSAHTDGTTLEYDVTEQGKIKINDNFIDDLQQTVTLFATDQRWTPAELVYWLDRAISHPDIPFSQSNPFLSNLVRRLIDERGFSLEQLVTDKYRLRDAVAQKIQFYREEERKRAYALFLLPECETPLEVHPEVCFTYPPDAYPYNTLYQGAYQFQKHYYAQVGDLEDHGEEFACAVYLDQLPQVKYWVRNLERRPGHSFWLQTATDRFYPDFVCLLNDGRYLVVEYKGQDRWSNDDSKEKRLIGSVWGKASEGRCLFVMPQGTNLGEIQTAIA